MSKFDDLVKLLDSNEVFIDDKNSDMFKLSILLKDVFKAGQQSKQAEIDELRKRIDVLSKKLNEMAHIFLDDLDEILRGTIN